MGVNVKRFRFRNIDGTVHQGHNLALFCREHGLCYQSMKFLQRGYTKHHKHRWFSFRRRSLQFYKTYTQPMINILTGEIKPIHLLGLTQVSEYRLRKGKRQQVKGWMTMNTYQILFNQNPEPKENL